MKNILITLFFLVFFFMNLSAQHGTPLITFGLIADIQYADCEPGRSRFYRNSLSKLDSCTNYLNAQQVQFTINLGDLVDRRLADLDCVLVRLNHLDNRVYNTTGNHDYNEVSSNQILYEKLGMPSDYYSFKKENWIFIILNTNEISSYANIAGTEKEQELSVMLNHIKAKNGSQGESWNGGIGRKQLEWMNEILMKAEQSGDNVLIFSHHPLWPESQLSALNNMETLSLIENYTCVKAVFSGHDHEGRFAYYKNLPCITLEGMVETKDDNAFGIVKIYPDKIVLEGKGRMRSLELKTK
ncbi:MAG: metallophosphoesterase [Tannerellaceae bacterium]|jgi:beta-galactosidase|nr:metallophosphoesterase [Tannerellaceae bacterium]